MKKITVFICAAALACSMSFPAFAAQTKKEYNTETAQVRQELADTSASSKISRRATALPPMPPRQSARAGRTAAS